MFFTREKIIITMQGLIEKILRLIPAIFLDAQILKTLFFSQYLVDCSPVTLLETIESFLAQKNIPLKRFRN